MKSYCIWNFPINTYIRKWREVRRPWTPRAPRQTQRDQASHQCLERFITNHSITSAQRSQLSHRVHTLSSGHSRPELQLLRARKYRQYHLIRNRKSSECKYGCILSMRAKPSSGKCLKPGSTVAAALRRPRATLAALKHKDTAHNAELFEISKTVLRSKSPDSLNPHINWAHSAYTSKCARIRK